MQVQYYMQPTGHDKTTSVIPCPAYLMKTIFEGDETSKQSKSQGHALWEAVRETDTIKFHVARLGCADVSMTNRFVKHSLDGLMTW